MERINFDRYGKRLMRKAVGKTFSDWGPSLEICYGRGGVARIDGTIGGTIAVEIEARTAKQIRGAVVDLIFHPYPKKLLVIIPIHVSNPDQTAEQCRYILARFVEASNFRVIVLHIPENVQEVAADVQCIRQAVTELGCANVG